MRRPSKTPAVLLPMLAAAVLFGCGRSEQPATAAGDAADPAASQLPAGADTGQAAYPFQIGTLSAFALHDGGVSFPNDNKVFGVGHTSDNVGAVLRTAGLPTDAVTLSIQPLLVMNGTRVLLFDTGAGSNMGPDAGHLADAMAAARVEREAVTDLFISHLHGDHVGGMVNVAGTAVFPNATVHLSSAEWAALRGRSADAAAGYGIADHEALLAAITPKVKTFEPGAEIIPGVVRAVDIQGHTPGHSGFLIGSGADSLLYIGDALHHSVISVEQPEWTLAFDGDGARAARSRTEVLEQAASSGQRIYAVHFPYPGIGRIEKRDGRFTFVPAIAPTP